MFAIAFLITEISASCTEGCECIAQPGNVQGADDASCAPCSSGQTWWPCGSNADVCECKGATTPEPVIGGACTRGCSSCEATPAWMDSSKCDPCRIDGYQGWPCNTEYCKCGSDSSTSSAPSSSAATTASPTTASPTTASPTTTSPVTTEDVPCPPSTTTDAPVTSEAPVTTDAPVSTEAPVTTDAPVTTEAPVTTQEAEDFIDSTVRKAQASVFGDYTTINWNQVICSMEESDAKPYMQGNPICATAINMGQGQFDEVDQNGNPGFCVRTTPGQGAAKASSCWKVRCVGGDNALNVGVSCKHHDWIYLKTVDTNMENSLSLTDDQYTNSCAPIAEQTNTPSCRAFDITVQAWNLMVVFASNQGSIAGEPAGLNGIVPVEYEEVDCNDSTVLAAIQSSHCGAPENLLI